MSWPPNDDLDAILDHAWQVLVRGVRDARSPAHTPTVATVGPDGTPQLRTVVLRGAARRAHQLRFHTDSRAKKVAALRVRPACALHVYDRARKLQLRLQGVATLHGLNTSTGDAAWTATRTQSRRCYQVVQAPGGPINSPDAPRFEADDEGRAHFVAVTVDLHSLEWLYLQARGHRRALFTRDGEEWRGTWLVP